MIHSYKPLINKVFKKCSEIFEFPMKRVYQIFFPFCKKQKTKMYSTPSVRVQLY